MNRLDKHHQNPLTVENHPQKYPTSMNHTQNQSDAETYPQNQLNQLNAPPGSTIHLHINNVNTNTNRITNTVTPHYSSKSRIVALLLCIFLGWIGIHRFYLGKTTTGVLYLLTLGLFYVGWIWDIIMLLLNNVKDGNGAPLT